jgi:hypothetical protein
MSNNRERENKLDPKELRKILDQSPYYVREEDKPLLDYAKPKRTITFNNVHVDGANKNKWYYLVKLALFLRFRVSFKHSLIENVDFRPAGFVTFD